MAQILDKQGLQHYANKMCNADNRKVGSKSLPTALNDIDTAIDGFKTLFESEYGTPVNMEIENNQNIFTIGTGININKKDNVENSFIDVELSGNSLVNCLITDKLYKDSNYLEFENSPVITEGNITLKSRQLNHVRFCPKIECGVIKPNTKYTLIFNVTSNNLTGRTNLTHTNTDTLISVFPFTNTIQPKQTGIFKYVLTSKEDINSCNTLLRTIVWNDCNTEGETITFSLMILEGDWTNKPIPQYFEGLKSVGEKENGNHKINISSIGKNLCPYNNAEFQAISTKPWVDMLGVTGIYGGSAVANRTQTWFYLSEGSYTISYEADNCIVQVIDKNENILNLSRNFKGGYVCIRLKSTLTSGKYSVKNLQIELSGAQTNYEYYKEDKKELLLSEPLRGLPNGIKDTIEKVNGEWKIIRRCVKTVLNGSEWGWAKHTDLSGTDALFFYINTKTSISLPEGVTASNNNITNIQCDYFSCYPMLDRVYNKNNNIEGIYYSDSSSPLIQIHINKSRLTSEDTTGLTQWLSQNPVTVIYELENYIIEDIDPITLQCWKNGTISIDEILPVETTHTVVLNKSAQIQKNIEELTLLRNRVKALEEQYDKTALNQAYEVELLRLDMQLDNII